MESHLPLTMVNFFTLYKIFLFTFAVGGISELGKNSRGLWGSPKCQGMRVSCAVECAEKGSSLRAQDGPEDDSIEVKFSCLGFYSIVIEHA